MITIQSENFTEYCPHCGENEIKELLYAISSVIDFDDNLEYACDNATLCQGCRADEQYDNSRM